MKIAQRRALATKYLRIPMIQNKFRAELSVIYNGVSKQIDAVIDTGCVHSLIPYSFHHGILCESDRVKAKQYAIRTYLHSPSFGIDTLGTPLKPLNKMSEQEKIECTLIRFTEHFDKVRIENIFIGSKDMHVSYDLTSVALIGMELLKDWDIHISESLKTHHIILMACPLNRINEEYINALEEEFNIGQRMIKQLTNKIDYQALEANQVNNTIENTPIDF